MRKAENEIKSSADIPIGISRGIIEIPVEKANIHTIIRITSNISYLLNTLPISPYIKCLFIFIYIYITSLFFETKPSADSPIGSSRGRIEIPAEKANIHTMIRTTPNTSHPPARRLPIIISYFFR